MGWTAIVNPAAGRGRTRRLLPGLATALGAIDARMTVSTSPSDAIRIAEETFARGDGVIACGGDGTVSALAAPAVEHDGLLAVVPTGSGNDFARHLGFDPRRPLDALDAITRGREGRIDLGRAVAPSDGSEAAPVWFCSVASTGFDAAANKWANGVDRLHGTPLYIAAMVRTLASYTPRRFVITADDDAPRALDAWLVAFGNSRSYGGGMRVTPDAQLDDGLLDVTVVGPVSRVELLRTFPQVFKGTHTTHPQVTTFRAHRCTIDEIVDAGATADSELYASGEGVGPLPATIDVVTGALRVQRPG